MASWVTADIGAVVKSSVKVLLRVEEPKFEDPSKDDKFAVVSDPSVDVVSEISLIVSVITEARTSVDPAV